MDIRVHLVEAGVCGRVLIQCVASGPIAMQALCFEDAVQLLPAGVRLDRNVMVALVSRIAASSPYSAAVSAELRHTLAVHAGNGAVSALAATALQNVLLDEHNLSALARMAALAPGPRGADDGIGTASLAAVCSMLSRGGTQLGERITCDLVRVLRLAVTKWHTSYRTELRFEALRPLVDLVDRLAELAHAGQNLVRSRLPCVD